MTRDTKLLQRVSILADLDDSRLQHIYSVGHFEIGRASCRETV